MKGTPVIDHLGNQYPSISAMLNKYHINYTAFNYRMNVIGMTLEEALTLPPSNDNSTAIKCTDHIGNKFDSKNDMCAHWGIPRTTYFRRIRDGWNQEKALTTPVKTHMKTHRIKDHLGQEYNTLDDMCKQWNISKKQYMSNIRNNCDIQDALTTVTEKQQITDHLGNPYTTINDMCKTYGITKHTLRGRIELGWTLKEILENPSKKTTNKTVEDHLGNKYRSIHEMVNAYNISENVFNHRLKVQHLSLQEALTPGSLHVSKHTDHLGNQFESLIDMLDYWNMPTSLYHSRISKRSLEDTLTTIAKCRYNSFGPDLAIIKPVTKEFYEVNFKDESYIWSIDKLFTYYRTHKQIDKPTMNHNMKIYCVNINNHKLYIIAKQENAARKKLKSYCSHNNIDYNSFHIYDTTCQELINVFHDKLAGIYAEDYTPITDT